MHVDVILNYDTIILPHKLVLVIRIDDYTGMVEFILVVVGTIKSYMVWRFGK